MGRGPGHKSRLPSPVPSLVAGASNLIRNPTGSGAAAGTPGTLPTNWGFTAAGLSREVKAGGVSSGIEWSRVRIFGTSGGTTQCQVHFEAIGQCVATTGQLARLGLYAAILGGGITNLGTVRLGLSEYDSTPTFLRVDNGADIKALLTGGMKWFDMSATMGASCATVRPFIGVAATGASLTINIDLLIGRPVLTVG